MTTPAGNEDFAAATVQALAAQFVREAVEQSGLPPSVIMAGALSQIATMIAGCYGGDQAAAFLRSTALKVESFPSMADLDLADAPAAGKA